MFGTCREVTKLNLDSDISLQVKLLGTNLQHSGPHDFREINLNISREV
jgi:hypothetical protein